MSQISSQLSLDFYQKKPLSVQFSGLELSSDAGLLLIRQREQRKKICEDLANCLEDNREPGKIKHSLYELVSQRVYQIAAGYEDGMMFSIVSAVRISRTSRYLLHPITCSTSPCKRFSRFPKVGRYSHNYYWNSVTLGLASRR